jgi:hypothetical protein
LFRKYISIVANGLFAADAQFLCKETAVTKGKSLKFRKRTRMPTDSSKEGQELKPL